MSAFNIEKTLNAQKEFFSSGATLPIDFRIQQLQKLKNLINQHEAQFVEALRQDLGKPKVESLTHEIILVKEEIDFVCKYLPKWARPQKVATPFPTLWPGRSRIYYQPYGSVLIVGPWNYPVLLLFSPLIGALAAGNCAVIKPSEIVPYTQKLIVDLINQYFPPKYITAVKADVPETKELLQHRFDYIFFTGGTAAGKIIMSAAAKHLTPVTLELGGKSPCIVDETINLDYAARRIAWGKTTNAGQICLAPDYLYVVESVKVKLIGKIKYYLTKFYSKNPQTSENFGRIVNAEHFKRLKKLIQDGNILYGGATDATCLYFSPTIIDDISWQSPIMQEEIFGPLLPILTFSNIDEVINNLKSLPKPLALYLFSKNKITQQRIMRELSFGGGCINDCVLHLINHHLPFGGVGDSGIGQYHGYYSFETFSHRKSIYKKSILFDVPVQYPPFSEKKLRWYQRLLRL